MPSEHCSRPRPRGRRRAEHARAVSDLSRQIGAELGEQALETLALAALLHDVGKNAVPEAILRKPGPLTPLEWELLKSHPERGERMAELGRSGGSSSPWATRSGIGCSSS